MNSSNKSSFCPPVNQDLVVSILPPILIIEIIIGLPLNLIALWIFCFRLRKWSTNTQFLFNLVLSDFLLLAGVPFRIDNLVRGENWVFGGTWCRINLFMLAVNRSASIAFMTAVAVDRYLKVVHPHHRVNNITFIQAGCIVALIWIVVISLRFPLLTTNLLKKTGTSSLCRSFDSYKVTPPGIKLHEIVYTAEFFLPLMVLLFCTIRITCILHQRQLDKRKQVQRAIRTVRVIVAVFIICFMPGILTGMSVLCIRKFSPGDCKSFTFMSQLFSLSIGFTYLNSALDPVIYCFSSSMFLNALKSAINKLGLVNLTLTRHASIASDL